MLNPAIKIAKSEGIDLPVMYVYLAGRIAGNCIDKCLEWRHKIINHYKHYKKDENGNYLSYPISFLDALNSKEADSIDAQGLKSAIPPNLIYDKDKLSVETAHVIVANMEDFFEEGVNLNYKSESINDALYQVKLLTEKISNRRENLGTICEVAWALYLQKPLILIVPEKRKHIYENHPFTRRASVIVTSVEQLLEQKWLQVLYKSIASAKY
jgi:hypothetical protein